MLWISCSWLLLTTAEFPPFVEVMHRPPRRCCRCPAKLRPVKNSSNPLPTNSFHQTWILTSICLNSKSFKPGSWSKKKNWNHTDHTQLLPSVPPEITSEISATWPGAENPGRILHLPRKHHPFRWWPSRSFAVRSLGSSWEAPNSCRVNPTKNTFMFQPTGEFNRNLNFQSKSFKKTYHTTSWNCVFPSLNIPVAKLGEGGKALRVSIPAKANLKALAMRPETWTQWWMDREVSWWVVKPI